MLSKLLRWWRGELRGPVAFIPLPQYDAETRNNILSSLASNPAFELLIGELRNRRALIENARPALKVPKSLDDLIANAVRQVEFDTQIREREWLERQVLTAISAVKARPADAA